MYEHRGRSLPEECLREGDEERDWREREGSLLVVYIGPMPNSWAREGVSVTGGKAYYLQLIGTNTSADNPWVVPEGHSVVGREGSYLIVRIDAGEEPDGLPPDRTLRYLRCPVRGRGTSCPLA